jgi:hypothetical protein
MSKKMMRQSFSARQTAQPVETGLPMFWRVIGSIAWLVGFGMFFLAIYMIFYYLHSDLPTPLPELGKIYAHDVHGQVVYIDLKEKWTLNGLFIVAGAAFIIAIIIDRWKRPFS